LLGLCLEGGLVRSGGELKGVALISPVKEVSFVNKIGRCVRVPSGLLVSAYYSTEISNVVVYGNMGKLLDIWLPRFSWGLRLFKLTWFKSFLFRWISRTVCSPDEKCRRSAKVQLRARAWVEGENGDELEVVERQQESVDEYFYTVIGSLMAVEHVLAHKVIPGSYTPSQAIDIDIILALASCDAMGVKNKSDLLQPEIDMLSGEFNHFDDM
jgi:short subunit dehydrogenase-like uncharacterized protein